MVSTQAITLEMAEYAIEAASDVCVGSKADIGLALIDVYSPESGHSAARLGCPLSAKSGHQRAVFFLASEPR
jgi:hypothetical protein